MALFDVLLHGHNLNETQLAVDILAQAQFIGNLSSVKKQIPRKRGSGAWLDHGMEANIAGVDALGVLI